MDESDLHALTRQGALSLHNEGTMPTETSSLNGPWYKEPAEAMEPNSLIDIRPATLVLSSIKKAESRDSIIVRLFNPYGTAIEGQVYVSSLLRATHAYECRIDEKRISALSLGPVASGQGQLVHISVAAKKIVTLEFS